jgi:hypothetical protein
VTLGNRLDAGGGAAGDGAIEQLGESARRGRAVQAEVAPHDVRSASPGERLLDPVRDAGRIASGAPAGAAGAFEERPELRVVRDDEQRARRRQVLVDLGGIRWRPAWLSATSRSAAAMTAPI